MKTVCARKITLQFPAGKKGSAEQQAKAMLDKINSIIAKKLPETTLHPDPEDAEYDISEIDY